MNVSDPLTHRDSAGLNVERKCLNVEQKVGNINDCNSPRFRRSECQTEIR